MAKAHNEPTFDLEQARRAAEAWLSHSQQRDEHSAALERKEYTAVDEKTRLAKRINRLITQIRVAANSDESVAEAMPDDLKEMVQNERPIEEDDLTDLLVERVLGATRDFLSVDFIEGARIASQAVGRVNISLGNGRSGYGTGFLVSPNLLLTNHHVFKTASIAGRSTIEFDYQRQVGGVMKPSVEFELEPQRFFANDEALDYALVAVAPKSRKGKLLSDYGSIPMIGSVGKITIGEPVNIIQHPNGELKQIVLRENKLLDVRENHLHYMSDTEPGSSGSPVFNDQWELVCLHHSGVPKMNRKKEILDIDDRVWKKNDDPKRIQWVANEGVRVSRLLEHLKSRNLQPHELPLREELLNSETSASTTTSTTTSKPVIRNQETKQQGNFTMPTTPATVTSNGMTFTIPLHITLSFGAPQFSTAVAPSAEIDADEAAKKKKGPSPKPLPFDVERPGFDPDFLGFSCPMPKLVGLAKQQAATLIGKPKQTELKYFHSSLYFNKVRRLAIVAAVNYNGRAPFTQLRGTDKWYYDPRIEESIQAGEEFYAANDFDRGHLVRRADAGWGETAEEALHANDDTFFFTNCSPQHEVFNQGISKRSKGIELWGKLEEHIQSEAAKDGKLSIFNGPIYSSGDRSVVSNKGNKLKVPDQFFKVVAYQKADGKPGYAAFILTQKAFIGNITVEEFSVGEFKTVQVKLQDVENAAMLRFTGESALELLESADDTPDAVVLESLSDVIL